MTRRGFIAAAGGAAGLTARNWERNAFPGWTDEFIDKLLTDSPWARPMTLPFRFSAPPRPRFLTSSFAQIGEPLGFPRGWPGEAGAPAGNRSPRIDDGNAPPVQTEIYLITRWASALPVRQAMALHQYGRSGLETPKAAEMLRGGGSEYVLEIAGFPAGMIPQGVRRFEAELLQSAALYVKGRKALAPVSCSVPEHGNHLIATLQFARYEELDADDGTIECTASAGPMEFRQKFKLRDMIYGGRLEL
jgi:hypothetical protein